MNKKILKRIIEESGTPDLLDILSKRLSPTDLQSLLLSVYQERIRAKTSTDIMEQYNRDRFVKPAKIDALSALEFDRLAFSLLPGEFRILELSPLSPLGSCSVFGRVSQNNVVSTARNSEVCSDATSVLALECALARKKMIRNKKTTVDLIKLCASKRLVRAQQFEGDISFAHFKTLSLCTAGKDTGNFGFESESLTEHAAFYLRLIRKYAEQGNKTGNITLKLFLIDPAFEETARETAERLNAEHGPIDNQMGESDQVGDYYSTIRFQMFIDDIFLVDGGFTDWTQQLLGSRKERLLTSGIGSERYIICFSADENV